MSRNRDVRVLNRAKSRAQFACVVGLFLAEASQQRFSLRPLGIEKLQQQRVDSLGVVADGSFWRDPLHLNFFK
jgi:hypothetical protein